VLALRAIRPVIKPVLYFLQRHKVFAEYKGSVAIAGCLLLAVANKTIGSYCLELLERFIKK
jgi:hypothetical protein